MLVVAHETEVGDVGMRPRFDTRCCSPECTIFYASCHELGHDTFQIQGPLLANECVRARGLSLFKINTAYEVTRSDRWRDFCGYCEMHETEHVNGHCLLAMTSFTAGVP